MPRGQRSRVYSVMGKATTRRGGSREKELVRMNEGRMKGRGSAFLWFDVKAKGEA